MLTRSTVARRSTYRSGRSALIITAGTYLAAGSVPTSLMRAPTTVIPFTPPTTAGATR